MKISLSLNGFAVLLLHSLVTLSDEQPTFVEPHLELSKVEVITWDKQREFSDYLSERIAPIVLKNTSVSDWQRWSPTDLQKKSKQKETHGLFRHASNPFFGPFYDEGRPMHTLRSIMPVNDFDRNAKIETASISTFFDNVYEGPPFYALNNDLSTIDSRLEYSMDLEELIKPNPHRSSVNLWLSMPKGVTPCHFDGYRNMYVQLYGRKRFVLIPPKARLRYDMLQSYPFLHPSYGQCQGNLSHAMLAYQQRELKCAQGHDKHSRGHTAEVCEENVSSDGNDELHTLDSSRLRDQYAAISKESLYVDLSPGDLLYIPPFWLHEVVSLEVSVSVNVWTDIPETQLLDSVQKRFRPPILAHVPLRMAPRTGSSLFSSGESAACAIPFGSSDMQYLCARMLYGIALVATILQRILEETSINAHFLSQVLQDLRSRYQPLIGNNRLSSPLHADFAEITRILRSVAFVNDCVTDEADCQAGASQNRQNGPILFDWAALLVDYHDLAESIDEYCYSVCSGLGEILHISDERSHSKPERNPKGASHSVDQVNDFGKCAEKGIDAVHEDASVWDAPDSFDDTVSATNEGKGGANVRDDCPLSEGASRRNESHDYFHPGGIWFATYIEMVALEVGSAEYASWFVMALVSFVETCETCFKIDS